jgi:transposase
MTWVGLDVHARSTHAAAIDVVTGELTRARFGAGSEEVVGWLVGLSGPSRVVYEAGPTGFALYRAARAAGVEIEVIAPSKTARPSGDRVKNDRKDAELLARLAMAGQLTAVVVPSEFVEAARHLARTREQVRGDLMSARVTGLQAAARARPGLCGRDDVEQAPPGVAGHPALRAGADRAGVHRSARRRRWADRAQGGAG